MSAFEHRGEPLNDFERATTLHAESLEAEIRPIMAGQGPHVQGMVLVQLIARWLAGHPQALREDMLRMTLESARELTPIIEQEMFRGAGHPDDRA